MTKKEKPKNPVKLTYEHHREGGIFNSINFIPKKSVTEKEDDKNEWRK